MASKKYLEEEGVRRLVQYIQDELDNKMNKGEISVPDDIVYQDDLAEYAKKTDIIALPEDLVHRDELEDYATTGDLETLAGRVSGVYHFRGSVANLAALAEIENPAEGDVYNLEDTGINAAWTGSNWDEFGTTVDLTPYAKSEDILALTRAELNAILFGGKTAAVSDLESINAMVSNDEPEVTITLNKDLAVSNVINVPAGKKVILDLGGNELSSTATVPVYANGGDVVIKNGAVSARSSAVVVHNGGSVIVDNATITSTASNAISAADGAVTINSGDISSQEAGVVGFKNSTITINGGTLVGLDNCPIMGNGSAAGSANDGTNMNVVMNGGKLVAHIQSAGYAACGIYVPNSGSFTMNGGEVVSDGAGLVMRGGQVNLNGGKIIANGAAGATGKVGDSRVVVGSYAVVYDANSKYPAKDTLELNIGKDMILQGTDGDIQILLEKESDVANINDARE